MKKAYTRKEAAEITVMPERAILYYTERGIITPDVDAGIGRGKIRRYSKKNLVEIAVLKELASMEISLGLVRTIMASMRAKMITVEETDEAGNESTKLISIDEALSETEIKNAYLCISVTGKGHQQVKWRFSFDDVKKNLAQSDSVFLVNYSKISEKLK